MSRGVGCGERAWAPSQKKNQFVTQNDVINVKFGKGELPLAKFHVYRDRNVGIQPPKLSKFQILVINFPFRGNSFAVFLRKSQRSYTRLSLQLLSFQFGRFRGTNKKVISIFPRLVHFPKNIQQLLAAKLWMRSKNVRGCKNGTDLLYHHAKYGGERGSRAGCIDEKV